MFTFSPSFSFPRLFPPLFSRIPVSVPCWGSRGTENPLDWEFPYGKIPHIRLQISGNRQGKDWEEAEATPRPFSRENSGRIPIPSCRVSLRETARNSLRKDGQERNYSKGGKRSVQETFIDNRKEKKKGVAQTKAGWKRRKRRKKRSLSGVDPDRFPNVDSVFINGLGSALAWWRFLN